LEILLIEVSITNMGKLIQNYRRKTKSGTETIVKGHMRNTNKGKTSPLKGKSRKRKYS